MTAHTSTMLTPARSFTLFLVALLISSPAWAEPPSPDGARPSAARPVAATAVQAAGTSEEALDPRIRPFLGTYRLADDPDRARAEIDRAFQEALAQIPNFLRPALRRQRSRHDWLVRSVTLSAQGNRLVTRARSYRRFSISSVPGEERIYTSKNGNRTRVMQRLRGRQLEIVLENRRGRMTNLLTLGHGGRRLHVSATFTSPLLDRPIRLAMSFDRVEPPRRAARVHRPHRRPRRRRPHRVSPRPRTRRGPATPRPRHLESVSPPTR